MSRVHLTVLDSHARQAATAPRMLGGRSEIAYEDYTGGVLDELGSVRHVGGGSGVAY